MQTTNTMSSAEARRKHDTYMFPAVKTLYKEALVAVEGKGTRVTDADGKTYLDFFGGILTISVGHANEEVNGAVTAQLGRLSHMSTLYPTLPMIELAERLVNMTHAGLEKCYFTASGTEADETALMLAQTFTGYSEFIALRHAYAGRSLLAQSVTGHASWRALPTLVPGVKHALAPYCYRCPLKLTYPDCGVACAEDVEELIQTTTTGKVSAMIVEPIQGVGGFITPPLEYFKIVAEIVRSHGGVMISDEVQTGFGRTGKMWGIEQYGVEPEMMTMAKGIANGLPLGAIVTTEPIAASLTKNTISTFGGNPVSCASANATLNIIERDNLVENSAKMGAILRQGLEDLQAKYPHVIGEVRGMGLMQAMELVVDEAAGDRTPNPEATAQLLEETRQKGLLIGRGGLYGNTIRIAPALVITKNEVEEAIGILDDSFATLNGA